MSLRKESINLSFLDLLSCGLGAGIILFLIFAALQHRGDDRSRSTRGVLIKSHVNEPQPAGAAVPLPGFFAVLVTPFADLDLVRATPVAEAPGILALSQVKERSDRLASEGVIWMEDTSKPLQLAVLRRGVFKVAITRIAGPGRINESWNFDVRSLGTGQPDLAYRGATWTVDH